MCHSQDDWSCLRTAMFLERNWWETREWRPVQGGRGQSAGLGQDTRAAFLTARKSVYESPALTLRTEMGTNAPFQLAQYLTHACI